MKGAGSAKAGEMMAFKLLLEAQKKWHKIRGFMEIKNLLQGDIYKDGILEQSTRDQEVVA